MWQRRSGLAAATSTTTSITTTIVCSSINTTEDKSRKSNRRLLKKFKCSEAPNNTPNTERKQKKRLKTTRLFSALVLLVLQFIWILPYLFLTNYLERSLLPFRLLCYMNPDFLSTQRPLRIDAQQCIHQFFGRQQRLSKNCILNATPQVLLHPHRHFPSTLKRVLIVRSAPSSTDYRHYIRNSWKMFVERDMPVVFIAGRDDVSGADLRRESDEYGDILQFDFLDSYQNLTLKMMATYQFFLQKTSVEQIVVVNDDVIVNASALRSLLDGEMPSESSSYLMGKVSRGYPRLIFPWLPWYVPSSLYPNMCYPPFTQGSSFIISRQAALQILGGICVFPFIHLDDIMMGIVTNCLNIRNLHREGFDQHKEGDFTVFHYQYSRYSAERLNNLYQKIKDSL